MAARKNRDFSHLEELKLAHPNQYQDTLKSLVDIEPDLFTDRQRITASAEVFEDAVTGELVDPDQLVRSMAGMEVLPTAGINIGYRNSASPTGIIKGDFKGDISINAPAETAGSVYMRVKDVPRWAGNGAARAFVDPASVDLDNAPDSIVRAAKMGIAAASGDGGAMLAANKKYNISPEYVQRFLEIAKIKGAGFGSAIRKQGLLGEGQNRVGEVIDPVTNKRVVDLGKTGESEFYDNRVNELTTSWLEGGGTGLNALYGDLAVPGASYQMEHNYPFSTSNEFGKAETRDNRVGFLERHVNSEKAEIDPAQYYLMQRIAYLADKQGITVSGVNKINDKDISLRTVLTQVNPEKSRQYNRSTKEYTVEEYPESKLQNDSIIAEALGL